MTKPQRRAPSIIESFNFAFEGIIHVLRTQRNMRIHFGVAVAVLIAGLAVDVSRLELIALLLAISFVLIAEMLNTAIEGAIDVATTSFDPMAKLAKDIAAGAVLIATVNAIAVGYLVFSGQVANRSERLLDKLRDAPAKLTLDLPRDRDHHRHRDEGGERSGHASARWAAVGSRRDRVRRLDGCDVRPQRQRASVLDLDADVHHGAARGADACRGGRPLDARGGVRRTAGRARDAGALPGVRMSGAQELVERARAVAARAYAPYSQYLVGAVVIARDGRVFEGVNVENAAYPLGICAEKTAIAQAVVGGCGPGDLEAIGITASPCGGCRQWLYEFRVDRVTFPNRDGDVVTYTPAALLPDTWELDA